MERATSGAEPRPGTGRVAFPTNWPPPSRSRGRPPSPRSHRSVRSSPSRRPHARCGRDPPDPPRRDPSVSGPRSLGTSGGLHRRLLAAKPEARASPCWHRSEQPPSPGPDRLEYRPRRSDSHGNPGCFGSTRPQWKASRNLDTFSGPPPAANSRIAMSNGSAVVSAEKSEGAPIEICRARAPRMRARSKRVYGKKTSPARRKGGPLNRFLPQQDPGPSPEVVADQDQVHEDEPRENRGDRDRDRPDDRQDHHDDCEPPSPAPKIQEPGADRDPDDPEDQHEGAQDASGQPEAERETDPDKEGRERDHDDSEEKQEDSAENRQDGQDRDPDRARRGRGCRVRGVRGHGNAIRPRRLWNN